jgi:peptidoglycan/xylan/chitin deacetylase (PgdA/CDA1 family)
MLASRFARREMPLHSDGPIVSFSFDDAPRSAMLTGARVLQAHGVRATYYLSLGLLGTTNEIGPIGDLADVERVLADGHEIGCHTYGHLDAWATTPATYLQSVARNQVELSRLLPGQRFRSFAYPKNGATLAAKRGVQSFFDCCRGGGQDINHGLVDLNLLQACFIDRRAGMDAATLRRLIDRNAQERGWLIFAAHDVSEDAADFACTPDLLESLVRMSLDSGAIVEPVASACALLRTRAPVNALSTV